MRLLATTDGLPRASTRVTASFWARTQGCDTACWRARRPAATPSSAAPQPLHCTTRLASLTTLNAVGVLLAARPSPYQLLSGDNSGSLSAFLSVRPATSVARLESYSALTAVDQTSMAFELMALSSWIQMILFWSRTSSRSPPLRTAEASPHPGLPAHGREAARAPRARSGRQRPPRPRRVRSCLR